MVQIMNCQNVIFMHRLEYHIHYFLIPNNSNQISFQNTCGKQKTDLIITCVKNLFIDTHIPLQGGLLAKSGKLIFQGRSFLEGKIQKNGKIFKKILLFQNVC